jgi:DHA2 family multidrug resistance protein
MSATNPAFVSKVNGMQAMFMSKGKSPEDALAAAYRAMEGSVMRQAAVLSYMDIFLWLGGMFLVFVPVMLLVRQRKGKIDPSALADAH